MLKRMLALPPPNSETFFGGARQTGTAACSKRPKQRIASVTKFYFADVGVVNVLSRRGQPQAGSTHYGKASTQVRNEHLKGLRELRGEHPQVGRLICVSLDLRQRRTEDGIDILPARDFARLLWQGELL